MLRLLLILLFSTGFCARALGETNVTAQENPVLALQAEMLSITEHQLTIGSWSRENLQKKYRKLVDDPNVVIADLPLSFPDGFFRESDYGLALHTSYLVWSATSAGAELNVPLQHWLETMIDRSKVSPVIAGYQKNWSAEIASLLLQTQLLQDRATLDRLPYYLDYLQRVQAYSADIFEQLWLELRRRSLPLKESPLMGQLYFQLAHLDPPYTPHTLAHPPQIFNYQIDQAEPEFSYSSVIEQHYQAWVQQGVTQQDFNDFSIPFPTHLQSVPQRAAAWHWANLVMAAENAGLQTDAPLLNWIQQLMPLMGDDVEDPVPKQELWGLVSLLTTAWFVQSGDQPAAVDQWMSSLAAVASLPFDLGKYHDPQTESEHYQRFWSPILLSLRMRNQPQIAAQLLLQLDAICGSSVQQREALMGTLNDSAVYAKWDLTRLWPATAHDKLVQLSHFQAEGRDADAAELVRVYAWRMRTQGYGDVLPREEALTFSSWRTGTMIDIYNERYLAVWLAVLLGGILFAFARPRHPLRVWASAFGLVVILPAGIFVVANLASIGHNHANTKNYLAVLETSFPFYALLVALFCTSAITGLYRRLRAKPAL